MNDHPTVRPDPSESAFERELRRRLADAAQGAPRVGGDSVAADAPPTVTEDRVRRRRGRRSATVAALLAAAAGLAFLALAPGSRDAGPPDAGPPPGPSAAATSPSAGETGLPPAAASSDSSAAGPPEAACAEGLRLRFADRTWTSPRPPRASEREGRALGVGRTLCGTTPTGGPVPVAAIGARPGLVLAAGSVWTVRRPR